MRARGLGKGRFPLEMCRRGPQQGKEGRVRGEGGGGEGDVERRGN